MKRLFQILAFILALGVTEGVRAEYLLWTVDYTGEAEGPDPSTNPWPGSTAASEQAYVWLVAHNEDSGAEYMIGSPVEMDGTEQDAVTSPQHIITDLSDYSEGSWTFFVAMGLYANGNASMYFLTEASAWQTLDNLREEGALKDDITAFEVPYNWGASGMMVPKPNSGLLLALGAALLALRRRRFAHTSTGGDRP